ncbi:MAG TPA: hypothetical protein VH331_14100 [Allosphingosinicella sp.]|jgi:hypothetical protein|nr:hypothetical protein [Allosphingosinicella sp.]
MMVNRKTADVRLTAWREGFELEEALELFSPRVDQSKLAEKTAEQRQLFEAQKQKFRLAGAQNVISLIDTIATGMSLWSATVEARESRVDQLIAALERGEWLAFGFPADRPKATEPEPVPQFLIQKQFAKWRKSEFSDGNARYSKVRIIPGGAVAKPTIGRPSNRERVLEIAAALVKSGRITPEMPWKSQASEIRKIGKGQFPDNFTEHRPDQQTLIRHLKAFWKSN